MKHENTSNQESRQEKPVIRRDKVVVTKVTEQELSEIKSTAGQCGMTRSDFHTDKGTQLQTKTAAFQ